GPRVEQPLELHAGIAALSHPLLEDRLRRAPQVELRVQLAAEALDLEQRLLQQHELRLNLHVELARGLEEPEQHEAERDVLQRPIEDRLADRAHRRLELVDARLGWDPPGIDVQRRDAPVVAAEEREEILGEIMLILVAQRADDAEVDRDVAGTLRVRDVDEDVPRMHVRMEEVVAEHLREEDLDAVLGEQTDVRAARLEERDVADRDAVDALHRQHVGPAIVPVDLRHVELVRVREIALQLRRVRGLAQQVDLVHQRLLELLDDLDGPQAPSVRPVALGEPRELIEHLDVALDQSTDIRTQDLHDDLGAVDEPRRMHLGDRRGGERLALEMREDLGDRTVERTLEQRERDVRRERRHLVLELRELVRELGRQQVAARRHGLAELHVDRPELLEREPEPLPERPRLDRRPGQELLQPRERPEQVGVPDDLVEPVAEQRPLDAQESERQPQAAERHQVVSTSARAHETRVRARRISMRASIRSTSSRSRSIASKSAS